MVPGMAPTTFGDRACPGLQKSCARQLGIGMARNRCRVSEIGVSDLNHAGLKRHIGDL